MADSECVDTIAAALAETTLEDITARHRRERKELQAKIQEIKKNAPKNDKKKRKEATELIAKLESELDQRQKAEIKAADVKKSNVHEIPKGNIVSDNNILKNATASSEIDECEENYRVSKAQKRRDKKAREARQREDEARAAEEDAQFAPKAIEARTLDVKLKERQLASYQVASDGDCLYNAVSHQLLQHGLGNYNVKQLRKETANYIRANKDTLICYMTHPKTGDLLDDEGFQKYCNAVSNTPAWGGHIELKALSSILKVPIEVLQAEGPPTVQGADEFPGPNLTITYHRHMYSLGEHYNSTMPLIDNEIEWNGGNI